MPKFPTIKLGLNSSNEFVYVPLEKNALTFAGAGAGKSSTLIIPNLKEWPHNALVIDPKGEAAEITAAERHAKFGGTVAVIDPFQYAKKLDPKFRAGFNPLDLVETSDDLYTIAEGLIQRTGKEADSHWNESAEEIAAGLLGWILADPNLEDENRNLGELRLIISGLQDPAQKAGRLAEMKKCLAFDGIVIQTAQRLSADNTEVENILGNLSRQTRWLVSAPIRQALSKTGFVNGEWFDFLDMKEGRLSVYLVLPPRKLNSHGRFLRLFVNQMLGIMQEKTADGEQLGERCLFVLDEFYSLGRLQEIVTASGQLRSSGVHLWPFCQSLGQLTELYGKDGLETFTEDANVLTVFGVEGADVVEYASRRMGVVKESDLAGELAVIQNAKAEAAGVATPRPPASIPVPQPVPRDDGKGKGMGGLLGMISVVATLAEKDRYESEQRAYDAARARTAHLSIDEAKVTARLGKRYMEPDDLRTAVSKSEAQDLPEKMLVFSRGAYFFVKPFGYFQKNRPAISSVPQPTVQSNPSHIYDDEAERKRSSALGILKESVVFGVSFIFWIPVTVLFFGENWLIFPASFVLALCTIKYMMDIPWNKL